jgi:hypothetical protein
MIGLGARGHSAGVWKEGKKGAALMIVIHDGRIAEQ